MATTKKKKQKVSFFTVLSLISSVLPLVVEMLNRDEPSAQIGIAFDPDTQKLQANVHSNFKNRSVTKGFVLDNIPTKDVKSLLTSD